jgi:hypothetical protein
MSNSSAALLSIRMETSVIELLADVADQFGLTPAVTVEKLILDAASAHGLLPKHSPGAALIELMEKVVDLLKAHASRKSDPDVTRWVFEQIKDTPALLKLHTLALKPPSRDVTPDKRKQFVHQRLGRFVKDFLGLKSGREIILPRGSDALIRSYTQLTKA